MRLWHNSLINILPQKQLLGQWRELNSIFKSENRHILINFVYASKYDLYCYSVRVAKEMSSRGYAVNTHNMDMYFDVSYEYDKEYVPFKEKMNDIYLKICLANLYEKYTCKGISEDEWSKIYNANKAMLDDFLAGNSLC